MSTFSELFNVWDNTLMWVIGHELELVAWRGPGSFVLQEKCRDRRNELTEAQREVYRALLPTWQQDWISLLDTVEELA